MRFFPEEGYKRIFVLLLYALIGGILLYAVFRYLLSAFLPFLIAFCVALLLRRPTVAVAKRTRIPRKLVASLFAVLFVSALLAGIGFATWKLVGEIGSVTRAVITGENALLSNLQNMLGRIGDMLSRLPFSGGENGEALRSAVSETVLDTAKNIAAELGTKIPEFAGKLAAAVPQALVFGVVTVLSAVYFCADYDRFSSFFHRNIHGKARESLQKVRHAAGKTLSRVLRSYTVLFLFTFSELLLGFVILGESYAFLLALLTALVDSLPILGTGTILLPMALYRFFIGDIKTAVGFAVLYGIVTVVRQILEPKILGDGFGMHPLLMLVSMYTGLRLFGVLGMIVFPVFAMLAKSIWEAFSLEKQDKKDISHADPEKNF